MSAVLQQPLRWGILGAGWISSKFVLDLLIPSSTRGAGDVTHAVAAVASRSHAKAAAFVDEQWTAAGPLNKADKAGVAIYGSYEELYQSAAIDVIYIGTPHSHHYENAHAALSAGKHVLCEKPLTVNAAQAKLLVQLARSKSLFLMEAVWTRFQPVHYQVEALIKSGKLGALRGVTAELCIDFEPASLAAHHRMVDPNLAGGALLDLGPYPWTWIALLLLDTTSTPLSTPHPMPKVAAASTKWTTGVDLSTVAVVNFPQADGRVLQGTMSCSMDKRSPEKRVVLVECSLGYLESHWAAYRPESYTYTTFASVADKQNNKDPQVVSVSCEPRAGDCWGFVWEQDETARCIRDGRQESERLPLRDTVLMMEVFDEIRSQAEFVLPEAIETTEL